MKTISQELNEIYQKQLKVVDVVVNDLFSEIVSSTPVDTGALKGAWNLKDNGDNSWTISNNMEYASIIFDGYRIVAGKAYGSKQLPAGINPVLSKYNTILKEMLKEII